MNMYVRDKNILADYTSGIVCVLANNIDEARELAMKELGLPIYDGCEDYEKIMSDDCKVYETPKCVYLYGSW